MFSNKITALYFQFSIKINLKDSDTLIHHNEMIPGTRFRSRSLISASMRLNNLFFLYALSLSFSLFDLVNFAVVDMDLASSGNMDTC